MRNWLDCSGKGKMLGSVCTRTGCELKSTRPPKVRKGLLELMPAGGTCWEFADFSCILILVVSTSYLDYCSVWGQGPAELGLVPVQRKERLSSRAYSLNGQCG